MKDKSSCPVTPPTFDLRELGEGMDIYDRLDAFADLFLRTADKDIGAAFDKIPDYCRRASEQKDHEEYELRRTPLERYYLELLSYTILSRQFRDDFIEKRYTVLILPDCLAIRLDKCEKKRTRYGNRCTACDPGCTVNEITQLAMKYNAGAFFADMGYEKQFKAMTRGKFKDLSVVGVACIMMLAGGMRAAEEAGVPAQGVLLNYCGCEHWTDDQFVTDAVVAKVEEILRGKERTKKR
ncbi:MAG: DUF116 domain-containing protein [bacterium]|nr:DUF116 domain-containing protein [bacterium]